MTEGVKDQEVSYLTAKHFILLMARSNLLVPVERKKNFTFFLSGRIRKILLIAIFSRPPGKA